MPPYRSISLPSRLHPNALRIESELKKLRFFDLTLCSSAEPLTAETIKTGLIGLAEVYRCVEKLVYSSIGQLSHKDRKILEDSLDDSVKLLDACGVVRETLLKMKEHGQRLQSTLRRRGVMESSFGDDIRAYIRFRKMAKKEALKCIRVLKRAERKFEFLPSLMVVKVLGEVNSMASLVLRSLLLFLSSPRKDFKNWGGGCLSISRLRPTEKAKKMTNEVESVDDAILCVVRGTKEMEIAHRKLETLVTSVDGIEAGLNVVFRHLIQYRVSILNVLTK